MFLPTLVWSNTRAESFLMEHQSIGLSSMSLSPSPSSITKRENHVFDKNTQIKRKSNFNTLWLCLYVKLFLKNKNTADESVSCCTNATKSVDNIGQVSGWWRIFSEQSRVGLGSHYPLMADRIPQHNSFFAACALHCAVDIGHSIADCVPFATKYPVAARLVTHRRMLSASHPELSVENGYVLAILFRVSFSGARESYDSWWFGQSRRRRICGHRYDGATRQRSSTTFFGGLMNHLQPQQHLRFPGNFPPVFSTGNPKLLTIFCRKNNYYFLGGWSHSDTVANRDVVQASSLDCQLIRMTA